MAFLFGWSELVLIRASAVGAISTVFGEYLLRSMGLDPAAHPATAMLRSVERPGARGSWASALDARAEMLDMACRRPYRSAGGSRQVAAP